MPDINQAVQLLILSHASKGGSVCLYRNGKVWNNLSALSILNAWSPTHKVVQKGFLDVCGAGGDGGKMGVFITASLLKSIYRTGESLTPSEVEDFLGNFKEAVSKKKKKATYDVLLEIGSRSKLHAEHLEKICDALMTHGVDSHISLERGRSVHTEVIQSEALETPVIAGIDTDQISLKGAMFAFFDYPLFSYTQVQDAMEQMGEFEGRPLCIVSPLMGKEVKATIALNRNKGVVEVYGLEAPQITWSKGWLEDLCAFTGGTIHTKMDKPFPVEFYGSALEVLIKPSSLLIEPYEDHAEQTAKHAEALLREAEFIPHAHTQDLWRKRASSLMGSLIRVQVGGTTEAESRVNLNLAEKSLLSMTDALENGYVEGSIPFLAEVQSSSIIGHAMRCPLRVVAHNLNLPQHSVLDNPILRESFPTGRLVSLMERSLSVAYTLGTIGHIIKAKGH